MHSATGPTLLGFNVIWVGTALMMVTGLAVIVAIYAAVTVRDPMQKRVKALNDRREQLKAGILVSAPRRRAQLVRKNETVEWMKARFPVTYFEDTPRMKDRNSDRHLNVPQTFKDARRVLVEVMVLSAGRALVHPVSNMATAALYINPEIQSVYLP